MQKNKYIKHTHTSEGKIREILRLFCTDLTSTQIAEIVKISRNTINRILQLLRKRIVELAEAESCFETGEIEVDESYFGAKRVRGKRGRGAVLCMKKRGDKVYMQIVNNCSASELVPIIKRLAPDNSTIYSDIDKKLKIMCFHSVWLIELIKCCAFFCFSVFAISML